MQTAITSTLSVAQGPVFRFAFALAVLGLLRLALLELSGALAAYATDRDRTVFWGKVRLHVLWLVFPGAILNRAGLFSSRLMYAYHLCLGLIGLFFRSMVILLPTFMVAHVYLWERGLGVSWPSFPGGVADVLSILTILSGVTLLLGRIYSPLLRSIEPTWTFFKPFLLLLPFLTGVLARHPTWSPLGYYSTLLLHVLSAAFVLALVPFARLLFGLHKPLASLIPEADWRITPARAADERAAVVRS
jgi:hypothetical protein